MSRVSENSSKAILDEKIAKRDVDSKEGAA